MEPTSTSPVAPDTNSPDEPVQMASSTQAEPSSNVSTQPTSDTSAEPIETASPTPPPGNESSSKAEKTKETGGKPPTKLILLFILIILLILASAAAAYWFGFREAPAEPDTPDDTTEEPVDEDPDPGEPEEPDDVLPTEEDPMPAVLFHVKDYDIYMYDVDAETEQLLVDHPEDVMNVGRIDAIDEDTIGFGSCETVEGDLGCTLFTYVISTETLTSVRDLGPDEYLLEYDFYDADTYAYAIDIEATSYTLYMVDGVQVRVADEVTDGEPYGRGGFEDDDQNLSFNPDGTRFFDINTSSPRGGLDFNIYIFEVDDLLKSTIEDATQPDWIDNDRLIYKSGDGLVVTDLSTGDTTDVTPTGQKAHGPYVLKGSEVVLYSVDLATEDPALWSLDLTDNSAQLVQDNATNGMWVSSDLYVFERTEPCVDMCLGYWTAETVALSRVPAEEVPLVEYLYTAGSHY